MELQILLTVATVFGGVISGLVNLLKYTPLVKDGDAAKWTTGFNVLVIVGFYIAYLFGYEINIPFLEGVAEQINGFISAFLMLMTSAFGSFIFHKLFGGNLPVLGKSFSAGSK